MDQKNDHVDDGGSEGQVMHDGQYYCRGHPNQSETECAIQNLYNVLPDHVELCSSGRNAIDIVFRAMVMHAREKMKSRNSPTAQKKAQKNSEKRKKHFAKKMLNRQEWNAAKALTLLEPLGERTINDPSDEKKTFVPENEIKLDSIFAKNEEEEDNSISFSSNVSVVGQILDGNELSNKSNDPSGYFVDSSDIQSKSETPESDLSKNNMPPESATQPVGQLYQPHIMIADELFSSTKIIARDFLVKECGFVVIKFDQSNIEDTIKKIKECGKSLIGFFYEICSNPNGKVLSPQVLTHLKADTWVVCDDTWTSPIGHSVHPRINIFVGSCAKYVSGNLSMGGYITIMLQPPTKKAANTMPHPAKEAILLKIKQSGNHVPPSQCKLILKGMENIRERLACSNRRATEFVSQFDKLFPKEDVTINWAGRNPGYVNGVCVVIVRKGNETLTRENLSEFCEKIITKEGIHFETSYGKRADAIDNYVRMTKGEKHVMLRLSIGSDDLEPPVKSMTRIVSQILHNMEFGKDGQIYMVSEDAVTIYQ